MPEIYGAEDGEKEQENDGLTQQKAMLPPAAAAASMAVVCVGSPPTYSHPMDIEQASVASGTGLMAGRLSAVENRGRQSPAHACQPPLAFLHPPPTAPCRAANHSPPTPSSRRRRTRWWTPSPTTTARWSSAPCLRTPRPARCAPHCPRQRQSGRSASRHCCLTWSGSSLPTSRTGGHWGAAPAGPPRLLPPRRLHDWQHGTRPRRCALPPPPCHSQSNAPTGSTLCLPPTSPPTPASLACWQTC